MHGQGKVYINGALLIGLRSAPKIFLALADALLWIMLYNGVERALHYLEDFLVIGPPGLGQCANSLQADLAVCSHLGAEKMEGTSTVLTFLGIEIDTMASQLHLPQGKLPNRNNGCSPRTPPYPNGRSRRGILSPYYIMLRRLSDLVLRSLINAASSVSALDHHVHLTPAARADICWWKNFLPLWNGISMIPLLVSDASGSWGCGAFSESSWPGQPHGRMLL